MEHNHESLSAILKRYLDGESSQQEEAALKEAFASRKALPPDIEEMRPMIQFFAGNAQSQPRADFAARLASALAEVDEGAAPVSALPEMPSSGANMLPKTLRFWMIRGIAAAVLIFVISQTVFRPSSQLPAAQHQTASAAVTSPEQAYAVVEQALFLVSGTLHKERKRAASEVKRIRQATSILHSPQQ